MRKIRRKINQIKTAISRLDCKGLRKFWYGSLLVGWVVYRDVRRGLRQYHQHWQEKLKLLEQAQKRRRISLQGWRTHLASIADKYPFAKPSGHKSAGYSSSPGSIADKFVPHHDAKSAGYSLGIEPIFKFAPIRAKEEIKKERAKLYARSYRLRKSRERLVKHDIARVGFSLHSVPLYQSWQEILAEKIYNFAVFVFNSSKQFLYKAAIFVKTQSIRVFQAFLNAAKVLGLRIYFFVQASAIKIFQLGVNLATRLASFVRNMALKSLIGAKIFILAAADFSAKMFVLSQDALRQLGCWVSLKSAQVIVSLRNLLALTYLRVKLIYSQGLEILAVGLVKIGRLSVRAFEKAQAMPGIMAIKTKTVATAGVIKSVESALGLGLKAYVFYDTVRFKVWQIIYFFQIRLKILGFVQAEIGLKAYDEASRLLGALELILDILTTRLARAVGARKDFAIGLGLLFARFTITILASQIRVAGRSAGRVWVRARAAVLEMALDFIEDLSSAKKSRGRDYPKILEFAYVNAQKRRAEKHRGKPGGQLGQKIPPIQPGGHALAWPLKHRLAAMSLAIVLLISQSRLVFAETTEITDSSVDPSNPVLQQKVEVIGNEGSNLISEIQKRVEEILQQAPGPPGPPKPPAKDPLAGSDSDPPPEEASENPDTSQQAGGDTTENQTLEQQEADTTTQNPEEVPSQQSQSQQDQNQESESESSGDNQTAVGGETEPVITASGENQNQEEESSLNLSPQGGGTESEEEGTNEEVYKDTNLSAESALTDPDAPENFVDTKKKLENLVEIINTNSVKVVNEAKSEAVTGLNAIKSGDSGENALIDTGDINVFANVLNVVNTNLHNSKIVEIAENFNSLSADVLLNYPQTTPQELAQDLVSQVCTDLDCRSLNSFTLTNKNTAEVENNVDVLGDSGKNLMENIEKQGTIRSGNVNAVVNILNIVNSNLINSRWTIASINIFGDFKGDLVLPSELYFMDFMSIGATDQSDVKVEDIKKILITVTDDNDAEIANNVDTAADSGQNAITATGREDGSRGELEDSTIGSGQSRGESNVRNFVNTNVFNGRWYLGMVNALGNWAGDVFSLPDQVAMGTTPTGLSFFATDSKDNDLVYKKFEETIAELYNEEITKININNQNTAKITNNVNLDAFSGENEIKAEQLEGAGIFSGNTYALANILNFANTNLINADLQIGLVNVFGSWDGNIVFGFPDLSVSQRVKQAELSSQSQQPVDLEFAYKNSGEASMINNNLEWHYDPEVLKFTKVEPEVPYTEDTPGVVSFYLGKIYPRSSGMLTVSAKTVSNLIEEKLTQSYVRIFGIGAERNKDNNESVLDLQIEQNNPGPENPGGGNDGNQNSDGLGDSDQNNGTDTGNDGSPEGSNQDQSGADGGNNSDQTDNQTNQDSNQDADSQNGEADNSGSNNNQTEQDQNQSESQTNDQHSNDQTPQNQNSSTGEEQIEQSSSVLGVILKHDAQGKQLGPKDKVAFTLTVGNGGTTDLFNVVLYSIIRDANNKVVMHKQFPFSKLEPEEGVEIKYDLEVTEQTPPGTYTNSAYAQALNFQLRPVQSQTAVTSFIVKAALEDAEKVAKLSNLEEQQETEELDILKDKGGMEDEELIVQNDKVSSEESSKNPKLVSKQNQTFVFENVRGAKITAEPDLSEVTPEILHRLAYEADADIVEEIIIPALQRSGNQTSRAQNYWTIIIVSVLIGLGYATANLIQRLKKKKAVASYENKK